MRSFRYAPFLVLAALAGCNCGDRLGAQSPYTVPNTVQAFSVQVTSVTTPDGSALSPGDGTPANPWLFPFGAVRIHVKAQALDRNGQPFTDLNHPVAVRVTPGDLDPNTRTLACQNGQAEGDITATHIFGAVTVWVIDSPADPAYGDGGSYVVPTPASDTGPDANYSNTAGVSQALYFNRPTLVDVQRMPGCDPGQSYPAPVATCNTDDDCYDRQHDTAYSCYQHQCLGACDNRVSPLTGDFVDIEEPYTTGDAGMIVTAVTQDGFYVQDLSAQKLNDPNNPSTPSWQALPGNFGQLFVYTYSAPLNLYVGDHLTSLTGSVQEFSGDTQLDFPGWVKVDADPTPDFIPAPTPITLSLCGNDPSKHKSAYDLCGYYNSGMGLESLESAPVSVDHVKPTNIFTNCDFNGNGKLPLIANGSAFGGGWGCFPDDPNLAECACVSACITGEPAVDLDGGTVDFSHYSDSVPGICSELSTYTNFGQWEVVLPDQVNDAGAVTFPSLGTRINVATRDALSAFNPLDLAKPQYQGIEFRISGMLNQVQAGRPRWLIYARDPSDVCCYPANYADGGSSGCPNGVNSCVAISGQ